MFSVFSKALIVGLSSFRNDEYSHISLNFNYVFQYINNLKYLINNDFGLKFISISFLYFTF